MGNLVNLTKTAGKVILEKKLDNVQANIVLAIDRSGSMSYEYRDGTVQEVVDRLLGIGMNMDYDKAIDVFQFDDEYRYVGQATEGNHNNFVKNNKMTANGGTEYAPVMTAISKKFGVPKKKGLISKLFGGSNDSIKRIPTVVFFITDGDNYDKGITKSLIKEISDQPIFWQFVGIGASSFSFLEQLDEMEGRYIDNANFFHVNDIKKIDDYELYSRLLGELPSWLKEAKAKGVIA